MNKINQVAMRRKMYLASNAKQVRRFCLVLEGPSLVTEDPSVESIFDRNSKFAISNRFQFVYFGIFTF